MAGMDMRFAPIDPDSNETGPYNRNPNVFFWRDPGPIRWRWMIARASAPAAFAPEEGVWPALRFTANGAPVTGPVMPVVLSPTSHYYDFIFDLPDGHYLAGVEGLPADQFGRAISILYKSFVVNRSGAPLPTQTPYSVANSFDLHFERSANGTAIIPYPVGPGENPDVVLAPKVHAFKPRAIEPFGEVLPHNQQWVRNIQIHSDPQMMKQFVQLPTGDVDIETYQKYFYFHAVQVGKNASFKPGLHPPRMLLKDGPRGIGALGHVYKGLWSPAGTGFYFAETEGRVGFMRVDGTAATGTISTFAGWRVKPGTLRMHGGVLSGVYMYTGGERSADRQAYETQHDFVGDWSRVHEPKRFHEPWGIESLPTNVPGDGYHEFWLCDTLNHRILYLNHYTAHHHDEYHQPLWPPAGYEPPAGPTGQTDVVPFVDLGNRDVDGATNRLLNEPFDCVAVGGWLYWTNFRGDSISRARLDGTEPEIFVESTLHPSDIEIGLPLDSEGDPTRLWNSRVGPEVLRETYSRSGGPGEAVFVRPQGIARTNDGNLIFVTRYTFGIYHVDVTSKEVTFLTPTVANNRPANSFGFYDNGLAVDWHGWVGPTDDIFVDGWHNADWRFAADGTRRGRWKAGGSKHLINGPLNVVSTPNYSWPCIIGPGRIISVGSAAGSQLIEITKRLPTDPTPDVPRWRRGREVFTHRTQPPMHLTHGALGQGALGYPSMWEMGSWTDAQLAAHLAERDVTDPQEVGDFIYFVRWNTLDLDYEGGSGKVD